MCECDKQQMMNNAAAMSGVIWDECLDVLATDFFEEPKQFSREVLAVALMELMQRGELHAECIIVSTE